MVSSISLYSVICIYLFIDVFMDCISYMGVGRGWGGGGDDDNTSHITHGITSFNSKSLTKKRLFMYTYVHVCWEF